MLTPDLNDRGLRFVRESGPAATGGLASLSQQGNRVLALGATGPRHKQVGRELGLSESAVRNHLVNVFERLPVKRRSQAAAVYVQAKSQHY